MMGEYKIFKKIPPEKAENLIDKEFSLLKNQSVALIKTLSGFQTKIIFVDAPAEILLKRVREREELTDKFVTGYFVQSSSKQIQKSITQLSRIALITFFSPIHRNPVERGKKNDN